MKNDDIFSRILEIYHSNLTSAEQRIADYVLNHPNESVTFSVTTLAGQTGTSEATVVRFARTLGFKGFLDFKAELLKRASRALSAPNPFEGTNIDREASSLHAVAAQEVANISDTLTRIDRQEYLNFASVLAKSRYVFTVGFGMSAILAKMASYQLRLLGKRSSELSESIASPQDELAFSDPATDCVWFFSFPPYTEATMALAQMVETQKLPCLLITDRRHAPVAKQASHVLYAANENILPTNSMTAASVLIMGLMNELSSKQLLNA
jgi:DNA-binding MurR/RpiR family transcriptional regulator